MTDTEPRWTWEDARRMVDRASEFHDEWQGYPVPLGADMPLTLAEGHPLAAGYARLNTLGGTSEFEHVCSSSDVSYTEFIVNEWFSRARQCQVVVVDHGGRRSCFMIPKSPDRSMERLNLWLTTMGAIDAWDLAAEHRARATLRDMLNERQWATYDLTGAFIETSPRSRVTYLFRRLRPTIAMSPRTRDGRDDTMRVIGVLCLHPVGYYQRSWAGAMVPSDDVIAHLSMVRGDEAFFWRKANQHRPADPEAGL